MHTSKYKWGGDRDSTVTVNHNSDFSGVAFVHYTYRDVDHTAELPGELLLEMGKQAAYEYLSGKMISFIEQLDPLVGSPVPDPDTLREIRKDVLRDALDHPMPNTIPIHDTAALFYGVHGTRELLEEQSKRLAKFEEHNRAMFDQMRAIRTELEQLRKKDSPKAECCFKCGGLHLPSTPCSL